MFNRQSFSSTSFSRVSFNGASKPVEQTGRSGYWRLFFHQLQEESLREKEQVTQPTVKEAKLALKPVVKRQRPKPVDKAEAEELLPFRPLPMFQRLAQSEDSGLSAWRITLEIRKMIAQFPVNVVKLAGVMQVIDRHEEHDIELLLLAA